MKEIRIDGLNKKQCEMLDVMWGIDSSDDLTEWLESLPNEDLKMAMMLKEILLAHIFDEVSDTAIAKEYLKKFRL